MTLAGKKWGQTLKNDPYGLSKISVLIMPVWTIHQTSSWSSKLSVLLKIISIKAQIIIFEDFRLWSRSDTADSIRHKFNNSLKKLIKSMICVTNHQNWTSLRKALSSRVLFAKPRLTISQKNFNKLFRQIRFSGPRWPFKSSIKLELSKKISYI